MNAVRNIVGVAIVGIIGIVITLSIAMGSNTVGWSGTMTNFLTVIIPIVLGAGIVMVLLYASLGGGKKDL